MRAWARVAGGLYLVIIAAGLFAEAFVRDRLVESSDAAMTAANIQTHQLLFRAGILADLATFVCAVPLAVILYWLLRPVNRHVALLMLVFNVVQDAIGGLNALNAYQPLEMLASLPLRSAFSPDQVQELALLSLGAHSVGFGFALIFFGCSCLALGYLIRTSGLFPRILGVLMALAGVCYLVNSCVLILSPRTAAVLFPSILAPAFIGELAFALWLAVKGIDAPVHTEATAPG
jgi:hypothetical protein